MAIPIDTHQHTIKKSVSCCGVGLHSGRTVNLSIKPAAVNSGIRFLRSDLSSIKYIPARADMVVDTHLATTIGDQDIRISTTEHLMAALQGFGIDNADIELDSAEVPIMDGSAAPFLHLLKRAGRKKQNGSRKFIRITKKIEYSDGESSISISRHNGFKITGKIDFDDELIRTQTYLIDLPSKCFDKEIARARTFGYVEQVEELWAHGLAQGGNLSNVIAIHWNRKSILNEEGLRFDDEFIRHKVLDLIGDLALLGRPLLGHVKTVKAGHADHLALMMAIAKAGDCWELVELKSDKSSSPQKKKLTPKKVTGKKLAPSFFPQSTAVAVA